MHQMTHAVTEALNMCRSSPHTKGSKFWQLSNFMAIFSYIFTAHVQYWLLMSFQ